MKKVIFALFFVAVTLGSNGQWAVSFIGQNGASPNARNITFNEWYNFVFFAEPVYLSAYNAGMNYEFMRKNIQIPSELARMRLYESINHAHKASSAGLWLNDDGSRAASIPDIQAMGEIIQAYGIIKTLDPNREYTFYSLEWNGSAFSGKNGKVTRRPYSGEQGIFLTAPSGEEYLLASLRCGNPAVPESIASSPQQSQSPNRDGYENFDTQAQAQAQSKSSCCSSVANSYNTTTNNYYYDDGNKEAETRSSSDELSEWRTTQTTTRTTTTTDDRYYSEEPSTHIHDAGNTNNINIGNGMATGFWNAAIAAMQIFGPRQQGGFCQQQMPPRQWQYCAGGSRPQPVNPGGGVFNPIMGPGVGEIQQPGGGGTDFYGIMGYGGY